MNINFEYYKVFYFVATTMSFSGAAQKLYISQSAVSQSIHTLEEKLGTLLFYRNTKNVRMTPDGEILFRHIEQAYNFIKVGERSIEEIHSLKQGEIRIGASDTICKYDLIEVFQHFHELYPDVQIQIINRTSPQCIELLHQGSIDFGIINLPSHCPYNSIEMIPIKTIQDVFVAGMKFSHLKNKKISIQELAKYPLLMLEKNTTSRSHFEEFLITNHLSLLPEIELGSIELLMEMARIGLGISLVIKNYVKKQCNENELFMLSLIEPIPERKLGIIKNSKLPLPLAAEKFIELL